VVVPTLDSFATVLQGDPPSVTRMGIFSDSPGLGDSAGGGLVHSPSPADTNHTAANLSYQVTQVSDTQYLVDLKTDEPVYLSLGESYHPLWNAYYPDGSRLIHFPAFYYANGYRVDRTGQVQIRLVYDGQTARNTQILISALTWAAVVIGLIISVVRGLQQKRDGLVPA
jgi:hypothetical protein